MKFKLDGREYESYQLTNKEMVDLLKSGNLTDEERTNLTQKIAERFEYNCCPRSGESEDDVFARFFSNFVNGKMQDKKYVAEKMSRDHRYLQNEMFKICLEYIKILAENSKKGWCDPRNYYAFETSRRMIDALDSEDYPY